MADAINTEQAAAMHASPDSMCVNLEITVPLKIPRDSFETNLEATEAVLIQAIKKSFEREKNAFERLGVRVENASPHVSPQAVLQDALFERGFFRCASALTPLVDVFFEGRTLRFVGSHYDVVAFKDPLVVRAVKQLFGDGIAVEVDSIQGTDLEPPPLIKTESTTVSR
jgi:hypothetical protein